MNRDSRRKLESESARPIVPTSHERLHHAMWMHSQLSEAQGPVHIRQDSSVICVPETVKKLLTSPVELSTTWRRAHVTAAYRYWTVLTIQASLSDLKVCLYQNDTCLA